MLIVIDKYIHQTIVHINLTPLLKSPHLWGGGEGTRQQGWLRDKDLIYPYLLLDTVSLNKSFKFYYQVGGI